MPPEIINEVRTALRDAAHGKGTGPRYLTSYQILNRLPAPIRDRLIQDRGLPGRGAGNQYTAASLVSDSVQYLVDRGEVERSRYGIDTEGVSFEVTGQPPVFPGYEVCALFRYIGANS